VSCSSLSLAPTPFVFQHGIRAAVSEPFQGGVRLTTNCSPGSARSCRGCLHGFSGRPWRAIEDRGLVGGVGAYQSPRS
jgi:hypothetical protein